MDCFLKRIEEMDKYDPLLLTKGSLKEETTIS